MPVNSDRVGAVELIDGQICHIRPNMAKRPSLIREFAIAICAPLENCEARLLSETPHA
jgi:hypothetical protein